MDTTKSRKTYEAIAKAAFQLEFCQWTASFTAQNRDSFLLGKKNTCLCVLEAWPALQDTGKEKKDAEDLAQNFLTRWRRCSCCGCDPLAGRMGLAKDRGSRTVPRRCGAAASNDIHSNLTTSKTMNPDGPHKDHGWCSPHGGSAGAGAPQSPGRSLTLDGGDYSQGTPYQDGYQKGWESWRWHRWKWIFAPWATTNLMWATRRWYSWVNARKSKWNYGVTHALPQLLVSNIFIKYDPAGQEIAYTDADIQPENLSTNAFGSGCVCAGPSKYLLPSKDGGPL